MAVRNPMGPPVYDHTLIEQLEESLGHHFRRRKLLEEALTHRSVVGPAGEGSNERLEFVGDRVLGLLIAEWLVERFPFEQEGALGRRLAHLVSQPVLADIAARLDLAKALAVGPQEARAGVRRLASVQADCLEAILGAIYLDSGLKQARSLVRRIFADAIEAHRTPPKDAKTELQEWGLARGLGLPNYSIEEKAGPSHAPHFSVKVTLAGEIGVGGAGSKRAAEQVAARDLLHRIKGEH